MGWFGSKVYTSWGVSGDRFWGYLYRGSVRGAKGVGGLSLGVGLVVWEVFCQGVC